MTDVRSTEARKRHYEAKKLRRRTDPKAYAYGMVERIKSRVKNNWRYAHVKLITDPSALIAWIISQPNFQPLFENYIASGFDRMQAPTVDRINSQGNYEIGSLQLLKNIENSRKGASEDRKYCPYTLEALARRKEGAKYSIAHGVQATMRKFNVKEDCVYIWRRQEGLGTKPYKRKKWQRTYTGEENDRKIG